ncbi:hypothetical protein I7I53_05612 [Histoplasma capsulatum var. duboisii H88]|uniref:Uncharacterized protein n=1 Tax=Ajellomyces capsulatus (strain H88) TaxID=544711 RepID=A0A8A1LYF7_AJEC8|nr:hypothetical protein I7I53_05612 [Histoplasma capsulatum var. duboisii H88]
MDLYLLRSRRSPTFYFWILMWLDDVDSCRMDWSRCRAVCVTWWWIFIPWILNGDLALHAKFFFCFFCPLDWLAIYQRGLKYIFNHKTDASNVVCAL